MLIVHHLGKSQSERIVWLCEELGIPYDLKRYDRRADNRLAPPEYKALHTVGSAPVIQDGDVLLAESAAIVDYIVARHGQGRLALPPAHQKFPDYLYWFHFANGTFQPALMRIFGMQRVEASPDHPAVKAAVQRREQLLGIIDARVGAASYLAGEEFSAADIMLVYSLTTMRLFHNYSLAEFPNIIAYLARMGARPGYRRAMAKGDPDMKPLLT